MKPCLGDVKLFVEEDEVGEGAGAELAVSGVEVEELGGDEGGGAPGLGEGAVGVVD